MGDTRNRPASLPAALPAKGTFVAAAALLALAACAPASATVSEYATLAEARSAGAVARGWIPESVPATARHLREAHNYDSREIWLAFSLPAVDVPSFVAGCDPVGLMDVTWPRGTRQFSWWPDGMASGGNPFHFYRCPDTIRYPGGQSNPPNHVAVGMDGTSVWFWRP